MHGGGGPVTSTMRQSSSTSMSSALRLSTDSSVRLDVGADWVELCAIGVDVSGVGSNGLRASVGAVTLCRFCIGLTDANFFPVWLTPDEGFEELREASDKLDP